MSRSGRWLQACHHLEGERRPERGRQAGGLEPFAHPDVAGLEQAEAAARRKKRVGSAITGSDRRTGNPRRVDVVHKPAILRRTDGQRRAALSKARSGAILDMQRRGAEAREGTQGNAEVEVGPARRRAVEIEVTPADADMIEARDIHRVMRGWEERRPVD